MASPMAHQMGFMYGLMMPVVLGCPAVILDVWDAPTAISIVNNYGATFTMASTPFLADLTDTVATAGTGVPSLSTFLCAGAPIPGPLVERAQPTLGTTIVSAWGMSENGAITTPCWMMIHHEPLKPTVPLPGVEVRIADDDGNTLPTGEIGRLLARACSNFGGYLKRPISMQPMPTAGSIPVTSHELTIRIHPHHRSLKDVIIRGGENIPVVEIENCCIGIHRLPKLPSLRTQMNVWVNAVRSDCCKPDTSIDFDGMIEFLTSERVAKNYLPGDSRSWMKCQQPLQARSRNSSSAT